MDISDIIIHFARTLDPDQRGAIETSMRQEPGVVAPRFNPGKDHLLMVAYDPATIHASRLLQQARRSDPQATLVGL